MEGPIQITCLGMIAKSANDHLQNDRFSSGSNRSMQRWSLAEWIILPGMLSRTRENPSIATISRENANPTMRHRAQTPTPEQTGKQLLATASTNEAQTSPQIELAIALLALVPRNIL